MPELPEVETIKRELNNAVTGKLINFVSVLLPRQIVGMSSEQFTERLQGRSINAVRRRGKYLLFDLDDAQCLMIHLRMTGRLLFADKDCKNMPYCRMTMFFADGSCLFFCDMRTFGTLQLFYEKDLSEIEVLNTLGIEPLTEDFSLQYLQQKVQGSKRKIKSVLLDQNIVAGLGNIYVDESLFLSAIHPERQAGSLSFEELKRMHQKINKVIKIAIENKGTTFRDYRTVGGESGNNQNKLLVYGRRNGKCKICGNVLSYKKIAGRGTHYCQFCQK